MSQTDYLKISGLIFLTVDILHALRIYNNWPAQVASWEAPMWLSWIVVVLTTILVMYSFKYAKKA